MKIVLIATLLLTWMPQTLAREACDACGCKKITEKEYARSLAMAEEADRKYQNFMSQLTDRSDIYAKVTAAAEAHRKNIVYKCVNGKPKMVYRGD